MGLEKFSDIRKLINLKKKVKNCHENNEGQKSILSSRLISCELNASKFFYAKISDGCCGFHPAVVF
jgi:hypothetical protein